MSISRCQIRKPRQPRGHAATAEIPRGTRPLAPGRNRRPGATRTAALVLVLPLLVSCLFSPRDPEPPDTGEEIPYTPPTEPRIVLENIRVTFNAKSITNYERSLSDDYDLVPDPSDVSELGAPAFDGWSKSREVSAMGSVLQTEGDVTFVWTPAGDPISVPGGEPNELYYEDLVYRMDFETETADTTVSGRVDLYVREISGLWTIFLWVDKRDGSGNPTLGWQRVKGPVAWPSPRRAPGGTWEVPGRSTTRSSVRAGDAGSRPAVKLMERPKVQCVLRNEGGVTQ